MKRKAMRIRYAGRNAQRGAVAIITALSLVVLVGFVGLALDLGHLYVNKTELQNAADACALAASRELTCDPSAGACSKSYLDNAVAAGITVATRNSRDFQGSAVTIAPDDIRFYTALGPNDAYKPSDGANVNSRFVMCIARAQDIPPWFMQVLGQEPTDVSAYAVATLRNAQTSCAIPIGLCKPDAAPTSSPLDGLTVGQWVTSKLTQSATGSFDWIDFSPPDGGADELAELLKGSGQCTLQPPGPSNLVGEQGNKASLGKAWNTRFGIYKGSESVTSAPPDWTGVSYTEASWPAKFNAYAGVGVPGGISNYLTSRTKNDPFQGPPLGNGYSPIGQPEHKKFGADRRIVVVPVVDCENWKKSNPQTVPILDYACVLMLHPMTKDNGPAAGEEVWLEYRGSASDPSSPCATSGSVGGPDSIGPFVPSLVQ